MYVSNNIANIQPTRYRTGSRRTERARAPDSRPEHVQVRGHLHPRPLTDQTARATLLPVRNIFTNKA